jgi:hypothetical protein
MKRKPPSQSSASYGKSPLTNRPYRPYMEPTMVNMVVIAIVIVAGLAESYSHNGLAPENG